MIVISPWTKGGWVDSQVFDHTSLIRFVERRFGVLEPNITPWRRAVAGDLTSAFNFASPNDAVVTLPSTASYPPLPQDVAAGVRTRLRAHSASEPGAAPAEIGRAHV